MRLRSYSRYITWVTYWDQNRLRQDIEFFVDGLPPTPTPLSLDASANDLTDQPLLTDGVERGGG